MKTLILTSDDVQQIVQHIGLDALMDELIGRLTTALEQFAPSTT